MYLILLPRKKMGMFRDFYIVLVYLRDFINGNELLEVYKRLIELYQQVQSESNEEVEKNIKDERKKLAKIHSFVESTIWSSAKIKILKHIKAYDIIGAEVIKKINLIFSEQTGNNKAIIKSLEEIRSDTEQLLSRVQQTIQNLNLEEFPVLVDTKKKTLEITFENNAGWTNFWEIEDRSKQWSFIINVFTRLTGEKYDEVKITSINSGSPEPTIVIEAIPKIIDAFFKAADCVLILKGIKEMFFKNRKLLQDSTITETLEVATLEIQTKNEKEYKAKLKKFSFELVKQFKPKDSGENINELTSFVSKALDLLREQFTDGSKIIDPSELLPTKTLTESTIGHSYKEQRLSEKEIAHFIEEEKQKRLLARNKQMEKETEIKPEKKKRGRPPKSKTIVAQ